MRYLTAEKAVEQLRAENLESTFIRADVGRNTVTLDAANEQSHQARLLLVSLDQRPQSILNSIIISKVDPKTGEEVTVSRPTLFTLAGQPAEITHRLPDGTVLKMQVTSRVIEDK